MASRLPYPLLDPSRELGAAVAAGMLQLAQQYATVLFVALVLAKTFEYVGDVRVPFEVAAINPPLDSAPCYRFRRISGWKWLC